jgi:hypothetical protein
MSEDNRAQQATADAGGTPPGPAAADGGGEEIAGHLSGIVRKMVAEHMNWVQGFQQWVNQMLMNMQQIPPEAHFDFARRQRWISEFLAQFEPVAAILKRQGHDGLAALLADYTDGFDRLSATQQETSMAMMKDDAETQRKLMGIQNEIAADNAKAAADRHRLNVQTAAYTQSETAKGIADMQESFEKMNQAVRKGLFGS